MRAFTIQKGKAGFFLISYQSASYLNERATRVRNAVTFPLSTFISIFMTSATRKVTQPTAAVSTSTNGRHLPKIPH